MEPLKEQKMRIFPHCSGFSRVTKMSEESSQSYIRHKMSVNFLFFFVMWKIPPKPGAPTFTPKHLVADEESGFTDWCEILLHSSFIPWWAGKNQSKLCLSINRLTVSNVVSQSGCQRFGNHQLRNGRLVPRSLKQSAPPLLSPGPPPPPPPPTTTISSNHETACRDLEA